MPMIDTIREFLDNLDEDDELMTHAVNFVFIQRIPMPDVDKSGTEESKKANTDLLDSRVKSLKPLVEDFTNKVAELDFIPLRGEYGITRFDIQHEVVRSKLFDVLEILEG